MNPFHFWPFVSVGAFWSDRSFAIFINMNFFKVENVFYGFVAKLFAKFGATVDADFTCRTF